jgi:Na+/H+ antiporter NhaA
MPLFAFANAGILLGQTSFDGDAWRVFLGVAALPKSMGVYQRRWHGRGSGFTMMLFIAQLAFPSGPFP